MSDPPSGAPYREAPAKQARWICTVCYRTATTDEAGECTCSGTAAPRLPLDEEEVIAMVRAHASVRVNRRRGVVAGVAIGAAWS